MFVRKGFLQQQYQSEQLHFIFISVNSTSLLRQPAYEILLAIFVVNRCIIKNYPWTDNEEGFMVFSIDKI